MSLPYVVSEVVWSAKDEDETKVLKTDFERCQVVVIEITTAAFTGTIDIQGKLHELSAYSNIPYIRQDQAGIQKPAVAQIVPDTDTGVYRYVILGYWRRLRIVMTASAGTITCGVAGSSDAKLFPYIVVGHDKTGVEPGVKTVTTPLTDVPIVAVSTPAKVVIIQAQTDNTGAIAVGGEGVVATIATGTGIILYAGDSIVLEVDDLADVWIDAIVGGEGVRFTYLT